MSLNYRFALPVFVTRFSFIFLGCQTTPPVPPPSLNISGSSLDDVKGTIIRVYLADGWRLDKDTNYQLVFLKKADGMAAFLFSSEYDSNVYARERVTISPVGGSIHISPQQEIVTNYGSAFERTNPVRNYSLTIQRFNQIESSLR